MVPLLATTTGYQTRAFGEAAERLGATLVFATDRCHMLEDPWRDGAIAIRFHDEDASVEAIVAAAEIEPIDGLITVGDRPTVIAARVAERLGLAGHPPGAARIAGDKQKTRECLRDAGLPVPWFLPSRTDADARALAATLRFPCVIKPVSLSGSRGVIRADDRDQFVVAFNRLIALLRLPEIRAERNAAHERVLVEGFIPGREFALEGLLDHGTLHVLALFDKPDPLDGPFFEETLYVTPSTIDADGEGRITAAVARGAAAIGLRHGPIHAECRLNEQGVFVLEIAARPIGGLCARSLRFEPGPTVRLKPDPTYAPGSTIGLKPDPAYAPGPTVGLKPDPRYAPGPTVGLKPDPTYAPGSTIGLKPDPAYAPGPTVGLKPDLTYAPGPTVGLKPDPRYAPGPTVGLKPDPAYAPGPTVGLKPDLTYAPGPTVGLKPDPAYVAGPTVGLKPDPAYAPGPTVGLKPDPTYAPGPTVGLKPVPAYAPGPTVGLTLDSPDDSGATDRDQSIGAYVGSGFSRTVTSRSLEELLLRHACGESPAGWSRETRASGVMMIPIPARGVYRGVSGVDAARAVEGVEDIAITAKPDQLLVPLPEGASYLGFIFARGATSDSVAQALRTAHACLQFVIEPELRVVQSAHGSM